MKNGRKNTWLPEIVHLELDAFEAGWLFSQLSKIETLDGKRFTIPRPGPEGEPVETSLPTLLIAKLNLAVIEAGGPEHELAAEPAAPDRGDPQAYAAAGKAARP